jgi:hypothetical protein
MTAKQSPKPIKTWTGTTICDGCNSECDTYLHDAKTFQGPWGVFCDDCFVELCYGHGLGRGQGYKKNDQTGLWEKFAG